MENVGKYAANNGLIGLINGSGELFIGRATQDNIRALEEAGYSSASLNVPFSSGQRSVEGIIDTQLSNLLAGRSVLDLDNEIKKIMEFVETKELPDNKVSMAGATLERKGEKPEGNQDSYFITYNPVGNY